jgi:hypothetical protein
MKNQVATLGIAALAAATVAVGCGRPGRNNPDHGRYATEGGRKSGSAEQFVKIDGCVQSGTRPDMDFMLRDVDVPAPAEQPLGQETMERPLILRGSWVRLVGDAGEVEKYLNNRVEITGRMQDSGENTLGTSGHEGSNDDKFRRSAHDAGTNPDRNMNPTTAAPNGADANGLAPRIAVEHVKKIADSCAS